MTENDIATDAHLLRVHPDNLRDAYSLGDQAEHTGAVLRRIAWIRGRLDLVETAINDATHDRWVAQNVN